MVLFFESARGYQSALPLYLGLLHYIHLILGVVYFGFLFLATLEFRALRRMTLFMMAVMMVMGLVMDHLHQDVGWLDVLMHYVPLPKMAERLLQGFAYIPDFTFPVVITSRIFDILDQSLG